jgi:hypothetical protein
VISCWNYATLGDEALGNFFESLSLLSSSSLTISLPVVLFCFDLYDRDCSNVLEASEIAKMLRDLYGRNFDKNKRAMKSVSFPPSFIPC